MNDTSTHRGRTIKTTKKSAVSRQRILEAAAKMLRERGYSGARLSDIAELADMKAGSLYYHFESREELVAEVMAVGLSQTVAAYEARLAELPDDSSFEVRLRCAIETHVLQLIDPSDFPAAMIKVLNEVPPELRQLHLAGERAYGEMWRDLLVAAQKAGALRRDVDVSVARMLIFGAMNWTVEWYRPEGGPAASVARQCADFVLAGIAKAFVPARRRKVR